MQCMMLAVEVGMTRALEVSDLYQGQGVLLTVVDVCGKTGHRRLHRARILDKRPLVETQMLCNLQAVLFTAGTWYLYKGETVMFSDTYVQQLGNEGQRETDDYHRLPTLHLDIEVLDEVDHIPWWSPVVNWYR